MKIKIENNVPIPIAKRDTRKLYPFDELQIGESFFINKNKTRSLTAISSRKNKLGKRFVVREMNGGTRVWRIK